jgi:DNA-binding SARP family transcriptional activator/tetratricopeptide (TPR) repeat protein
VTSVRLLGKAKAELGEKVVEFSPNKRFQLLAYLAYQGDWVTRDKLVFLFWPDEPNHTARQNLRQLLKHVRNFTWLENFESDESRLRWLVKTDVAVFRKALEKDNLGQALHLYQGEFCADLENGDAGEFANWLESERQTLGRARTGAALRLVTELEAKEDFARAASVFERYYQDEPLAEEHLRRYLANLARSGQEDKSREVFEDYKSRLERDFQGKPETETFELIDKIRRGEVVAKASVVKTARPPVLTRKVEARHNLPAQSTLFVGRETERQRLSKVLAGPNCRLLSVVAPGGMGKTRLAIEVAKTQFENFEEVCFVSLVSVASADLMVYTIADALELSFFGPKSPKEQLLEYLENKDMLLVLDNLEHLLSGVDLIDDVLKISPGVKILTTSRETLNLQAEHVFDLSGLAVPEHANAEAQKFDALQLFAERARHNRLDFVLEQHLQPVTRICQRVAGMPLAIELAASWLRLLSTEEIASEIEKSIDVFSSLNRDVPERHRSMRKVFEASWQRLTDAEQSALQKLSAFRGGFEREAARAVAALELPVLLSLVNKSFLWRDDAGRFSQHPLILQYIQDKANDYPEERNQTEEKHGLYYLELVKKLVKELRTGNGQEVRGRLEKEFPNIRAAWNWTLREKRWREMPRYTRDLDDLLRNNPHEALQMFTGAVTTFDEANPEHHAALGYALIGQAGYESYFDVERDSLVSKARRGLALLEPLGEYEGTVQGQMLLGLVAINYNELAKGKEILTPALELARKHGFARDIGWILLLLSRIEGSTKSFAEGCASMRATLAELHKLGDLINLALGFRVFGTYLAFNGEFDEGEQLLRKSLDLLRTLGYGAFPSLTNLAELLYRRGNYSEAEGFTKEAYELASRLSNVFQKVLNLALLGGIKLAQGHVVEAERFMIEGLRLGYAKNIPFAVCYALVFLARLDMAKGHVQRGVTLLHFLRAYPSIEKYDRDEAIKLLEKAKAQLSPQEFAQAQEESKSLTLEGIVTGILEQANLNASPETKLAARAMPTTPSK